MEKRKKEEEEMSKGSLAVKERIEREKGRKREKDE